MLKGTRGTRLSDEANFSAEQSVRAVNPIVEAERQTVYSRLVIVRREAGEKFLHHVGPPVAIRVFGVKNVRRGANENAFAPRKDAGWKWKIIEEQRGVVVAAITVPVFEKLHGPSRLPLSVDAHWIVAHFHDPQFPIRAPIDGDRVNDERFSRDEIDRELRRDSHRIQRCLRRKRPQRFSVFLFCGKPARQQIVNSLDDSIFAAHGESRGTVVIPKRILRLVSAFGENAPRRDVARHVIGIAVHPQARIIELALQPPLVVHDHFAREEDHREIVAKNP